MKPKAKPPGRPKLPPEKLKKGRNVRASDDDIDLLARAGETLQSVINERVKKLRK